MVKLVKGTLPRAQTVKADQGTSARRRAPVNAAAIAHMHPGRRRIQALGIWKSTRLKQGLIKIVWFRIAIVEY